MSHTPPCSTTRADLAHLSQSSACLLLGKPQQAVPTCAVLPWLCHLCEGAPLLRRVPDDCTYEEGQLVRDCLQNEPDERPSAKDLVNRLAGSTHRNRDNTPRAGSSLTGGGHISGQLLADGRCAGLPHITGQLPQSFMGVERMEVASQCHA